MRNFENERKNYNHSLMMSYVGKCLSNEHQKFDYFKTNDTYGSVNIYELNLSELMELRDTYFLFTSVSSFEFETELVIEFFDNFNPKISYSEFYELTSILD